MSKPVFAYQHPASLTFDKVKDIKARWEEATAGTPIEGSRLFIVDSGATIHQLHAGGPAETELGELVTLGDKKKDDDND